MALVDTPRISHRDGIWGFATHDLHERGAKPGFYSYAPTGNTSDLPRLLIPTGSHLTQRPEMNETNFGRLIPPEPNTLGERPSRRAILKAPMPSGQISSSSSSDSSQELPTPILEPETPHIELPTPSSSQRVHFRSRVRITSGIRRPRQHTKFPTAPELQSAFDPFSPQHGSIRSVRSRASSPSSSISVPLRTPADGDTNKQGWGPLGQRVGLLACQRRSSRGHRRINFERRRGTQSTGAATNEVSERTPLVQAAGTSRYYVEGEGMQPHNHHESDRDDEDQLSHEIDRYFGRWPVRLLNPHWWWWQLEPIVCCRFEDDDGEY